MPDEEIPEPSMGEQEFADEVVKPWLEHHFGEGNVREEVYLGASTRYVDYVASGALADWCVEVENDAGSLIKGAGQAILYASHRPAWRPCVVIPDDQLEQPEADMIDEHVRVIGLPTDLDAAFESE